MKRFLSFAAFAMMLAATALSFSACGSHDDDDDLDKLPDVPKTAEQARKMLIGQWEVKLGDFLEEYQDEGYYEFTADGKMLLIEKIKSDAPDGQYYSKYKGQYIGYVDHESYELLPNEDDPSSGHIAFPNPENPGKKDLFEYAGLSKKSLMFFIIPLERVKTPIQYTLIDNPL
ncbi:MAG: hypothetical protein IJ692_00910 [Alloprevotella sp.]|nr:hypothetical protein [Alloprevotella sp.]